MEEIPRREESEELRERLLHVHDVHKEWEEIDGSLVYRLSEIKPTPKILKYLIFWLIILTQLAFLYGQIQIMWYLSFDISFAGTVEAISWDSKLLFRALSWPNPQLVNLSQVEKLDEFTYGNAIGKLWKADGLSSLLAARFGAFLLILFSGIWPHLKLLSLNYYFFAKVSERERNKVLYWISSFGKYSIADVFVVCILISICKLTLTLHPDIILRQLKRLAPKIVDIVERSISQTEAVDEVCNTVLNLANTTLCSEVVALLYTYPSLLTSLVEEILGGILVSGQGFANLTISGLSGLHVFCIAVLSSMLVGVLVDVVSHRAKAHCARHRVVSRHNSESLYLPYFQRISNTESKLSIREYLGYISLAVLAMLLGILSVTLKTIQRDVPGSIPSLVNETLFLDFRETYSLWTFVTIIGEKGSMWDYFLKLIFAFFCVVGPLLRVFVILVQLLIPQTKRQQIRVLTIINNLGVFCALDVFIVSLLLVEMEMGPITNTIIDQDSKFCTTLRLAGYPESCLTIEFTLRPEIVVLFMYYFVSTFLSVAVIRNGFKGLDPYQNGDSGGPW